MICVRKFIERVDSHDSHHDIHYLPQHGVKKDSLTILIRIVYDYSAKQSLWPRAGDVALINADGPRLK